MAISKSLRAAPWPYSLALAAGAAAVGFANVARIKSAKAGFRLGTPNLDFADFGSSTATALHGQEAVIPKGTGHVLAEEIAAAMGGRGSGSPVHITIQAWDGADVERVVRGRVVPQLKQMFTLNTDDLSAHTRRALAT